MCKFLVQQSQYTTIRPVVLRTLVGHSHKYVINFCFVRERSFVSNNLHLQYQGRTLSEVPNRSIKSRQTLHVILVPPASNDNVSYEPSFYSSMIEQFLFVVERHKNKKDILLVLSSPTPAIAVSASNATGGVLQ